MMIHVIIHLSKPTERIIPSMNPDVNSGLVAIMMCQFGLSIITSVALSGALMVGEAVYVHYGKSLYFYSAVNLELLLKKKKQPIKK